MLNVVFDLRLIAATMGFMQDDEAARLVAYIKNDLMAAMKRRDQVETSALKSLLASFANAEAVNVVPANPDDQGFIAAASRGVGSTEAARKQLGVRDLHAIIKAEIDELQQTIAQLDESSAYRAELQQKQAVLERYQAGQ